MRLPFVPATGFCRRCGRDAAGLSAEYLCDDCISHPPGFDRAGSALRFEGCARELVNAFKFRGAVNLVPDFVDILEATARTHFKVAEIDVVLPMPSTLRHRFLRGYNQCSMLTRLLARRLGKCHDVRSLRRIGNPRTQGGLDEESRRENAVGTFEVTPHGHLVLKGTVLLVDDIMTTGSTLSEASKTIKSATGCRVWCLSLARSIRD